ncbi:MAG: hypothetical protein NTX03_00455 [Bacteroidetes bacterium]|nr:hypothetical protein [Bacteroidota bacterium]
MAKVLLDEVFCLFVLSQLLFDEIFFLHDKIFSVNVFVKLLVHHAKCLFLLSKLLFHHAKCLFVLLQLLFDKIFSVFVLSKLLFHQIFSVQDVLKTLGAVPFFINIPNIFFQIHPKCCVRYFFGCVGYKILRGCFLVF